MAEYDLIERNKIFEKVTELYRYSKGDMHIAYRELLDCILDMPAADVQPIRRGRWIIADDVEHFIAICSECGRTEDSRDIKDMPYCHCGARMDGDTNDRV
ncbi:hypothetical protein [Ruminococcus flavefaciens]|uniref:hypothetical protein n=1 Tax=Ruminococcus flavefaciens TaxID=1265 RepID=UPI0026EEB428|nr:hypothetical protein [Ruminococcus flavefaciens]